MIPKPIHVCKDLTLQIHHVFILTLQLLIHLLSFYKWTAVCTVEMNKTYGVYVT